MHFWFRFSIVYKEGTTYQKEKSPTQRDCYILELRETKLQRVEASCQSFKRRGWAVYFVDLTSLYLRLEIGAGQSKLIKRTASKLQPPTPIKRKRSKRDLNLKKQASIRESHCALAPCIVLSLFLMCEAAMLHSLG